MPIPIPILNQGDVLIAYLQTGSTDQGRCS